MHAASVCGAGPGAKAASSLNQGGREKKAPLETVVGGVGVGVSTHEVPGAATPVATCGRDPTLSPGQADI